MMRHILITVIVCVLVVVTFGAKRPTLLRDGFEITGLDGYLSKTESGGWSFAFDRDVTDSRAVLRKNVAVKMLPCAGLETMIASAKNNKRAMYRIWATATRYRGENYLFANYSLPVSVANSMPKISTDKTDSASSNTGSMNVAVNQEQDLVQLPDDIVERMQSRKIVQTHQLQKTLELKRDMALIDRTGFIVEKQDGFCQLRLDSLGRNIQNVTFEILPCEALSIAQRKQATEPEQIRLKVAGIITKFQGKNYLLLQRAKRVYSYQNFHR